MKKKKQPKSRKAIIVGVIAVFFILLFTTFVVTNKDARDFVIGSFARTPTNQSNVNDSDYLVGVYYMPKPAFLNHQFQGLMAYNRTAEVASENRFEKPLLGYYSGTDQESMDMQIQWARDYGVDYFVFDDFWTYGYDKPTYPGSLDAFVNSKNTTLLKFSSMITDISIPSKLPKLNESRKNFFKGTLASYYKNNYFTKANYLRINGKPVVTIYPNVFGSEWNDIESIKNYLSDFEKTVGQKIYWIYCGDEDGKAEALAALKARGFDAVSPYYIAPGVTFAYSSQPKEYSVYTQEAFVQNQKVLNSAKTAGIAFVPSATSNFDERWRYLRDSSIARRSYTVNGTLGEYEKFLTRVKNLLDNNKNSAALVRDNDSKTLVTLGAWNEWGEGSHIEPGYSLLNPSDPFALIKTVSRVFEPSKLALIKTAPSAKFVVRDRTIATPEKTSWNFGSDDAKLWYIQPSSYFVGFPSGKGATANVLSGRGFTMEGSMNVDTSKFKGIRIPTIFNCRTNDCIKSIGVTWYTTSCSGDKLGTCVDKKSPNKQGTVFIDPKKCVKSIASVGWMACDLLVPDGPKKWSDKLELLRITFYFRDESQNATYIGLGTVELIPR